MHVKVWIWDQKGCDIVKDFEIVVKQDDNEINQWIR